MNDSQEYLHLCERVSAIDPEAGKYLREDAPKLGSFVPSGNLLAIFFGQDTPQGVGFWDRIYDLLEQGEDISLVPQTTVDLDVVDFDDLKTPAVYTGMLTESSEPPANVSDGSTADYYQLPPGATELQDLISARDMNAQMGEIFRACYRYGQVAHSPKLRDIKKIIFYAQAELERLKKYGG